jgi:HD-GYP domain-containing protein (c-di-GMP phosphodiesterase class II)
MLKRIDPTDVVLGMFIQKLEGNWFSHPFWRANFLLTDPAQLERLHASRVPAVIIDTELGIDPDAPTIANPSRPAPSPAMRLRQPAPPPPVPPVQSQPRPPARVMAAPPAEVGRGFGKANAVAERGLKAVAHVFLEMRLGKAIAPATVTPVIDSIIASIQDNPFAFNGMMCFRRDNEQVYRHALATSALMIALGRNLHMAQFDLHAAGLSGLLLDSGVNLLPTDGADRVADPRQLPHEIWHSHVQLGHDFIVRSRLSSSIARACLEHHERMDGGGWPNGVGGSGLSKLGRMAAICDAYDLLANGGSGQSGLDPAEALRQMQADRGAFDPDLLAVFETTVGVWPTGSVVELRSGRLAVVVQQNLEATDRPLVAVFFAPATGQRIDDVWIDLNTCYGADAIVGPGLIETLPSSAQASAAAAMAATIDRVAPTGKSPARAHKAA